MPHPARTLLSLFGGVVLSACAATAAQAFVARHLYVAGDASASAYGPLMRYAVADGVPGGTPERVFEGWHGPIASDFAGNVFAESRDRLGPLLGVFGPTSNRAERTIIIRNDYFLLFETGLAVDRAGYTFVFEYEASLRHGTFRHGGLPSYSYGCAGSGETLVYAPGARGFASPVTCYFGEYDYGYPTPVIDGSNHMYYASFDGTSDVIRVYAGMMRGPRQVREMSSRSFENIDGVAVDRRGNLFVLNEGSRPHLYSYVATYDASASGPVLPLRTLAYPTKQTWIGGIAVDDRYLYITAGDNLLIYDKTASGRVLPKANVALPNGPSDGPYVVAVSK